MKKPRWIFLLFAVLVLYAGKLHAANYYVSPSGDDTHDGTFDKPWKTIARANTLLSSGDTVYIRAGSYAETIKPNNSGTSGNYILFQPYNSESVTICGIKYGADLSGKSYIKISGINFGNMTTSGNWILSENGDYNIYENCIFESTSEDMGYDGFVLSESSNYNQIRDCTLKSTVCQPSNLIAIYGSDHNLIIENSFGKCAHTACTQKKSSHHNIIKNNTFRNPWHHNLATYNGSDYALVESNYFYDAGDECGITGCSENRCGDVETWARNQANGYKIGAEYCIVRKNIFSNNGNFVLSAYDNKPDTDSLYNRIYHNTSHADYIGLQIATDATVVNPLNYNILKNNIFSNPIDNTLVVGVNLIEKENNLTHNNFYNGKAVYKIKTGLSEIEDFYPNEVFNNLSIDPKFTNTAARDFTLQSSSSMRDAADWLTTITSATGSGTTFTVDDAKYFMDGWGIIAADQIQLEKQTQPVRIKTIDYATNTIQVERSITWTKGLGVSLPYSGSAPDIGAYEYGAANPPPAAPWGLTVR